MSVHYTCTENGLNPLDKYEKHEANGLTVPVKGEPSQLGPRIN